MHEPDALGTLARLAVSDTADPVVSLTEATHVIGAATGSDDVRLMAGDGVNFEAYPLKEDEDFFGLSPAGLMSASQELRKLGGAGVYTVGGEGLPERIAPADGKQAGTHVGLSLWKGETFDGTVVAGGPWSGTDVRRVGRFLELAAPALAILFERVADAERTIRIERQMDVLADVARVFTQSGNMRDLLREVVDAINSATGFFSNIDVLDARGRISMRSTAASRYTGTPLYQAWLKLRRAPDPIRKTILKDHQPVLLPDLQNDPRISEEARQFYRQASIVSAATFPLLFQQELVGLLRVASLKPVSFAPPVVDLLRHLALQAAVVLKGIQLRGQLQRSRRETERYAAKLRRRNEELLAEISERQRAEEALKKSEAKYRQIFENVQDIYYRTDANGIIVEINPTVERYGYTREELIGTQVLDVYEDPEERAALLKAILERGEVADYEIHLTTGDGRVLDTSVSAHSLRDADGTFVGVEGTLRNITERKRMEEQLREQVRRDPLTGALNHAAIVEGMRSLVSGDGDGAPCAVAMVDVDDLKATNDTYGHQVGDAVLVAVAEELSRDGAMVGRYGGDEFVALLPDTGRKAAEAYREEVLAALAGAALRDPESGASVQMSVSVGLATYPTEAGRIEELIDLADSGMYGAKRQRPLASRGTTLSQPLGGERAAKMVGEIVPLLTSPGEISDKVRLVAHRLSVAADYDAVNFALFGPEPEAAPEMNTFGRLPADLLEGWRREQDKPGQDRHPIRLLLEHGRPIILDDPQHDRRLTKIEREMLRAGGLQSALVAPMLWQNELVGLLSVASKREAAFTPRDAQFLTAVATQVTAIVRMSTLVEELQSASARLTEAHAETVMLLAAAAEAHDRTTGQHLQNVQTISEALARELGHSEGDARDVGLAAVLHDIGKIRVPDSVLASVGRLGDEEWGLMKQHTVWGEEFLTGRPGFELAATIARSHHERWDGGGYPDGLAGETIPEAATIVAVADSFDAMTSDRPYRPRRSVAQAMREIVACSGEQFSPRVVQALAGLHKRRMLYRLRRQPPGEQAA